MIVPGGLQHKRSDSGATVEHAAHGAVSCPGTPATWADLRGAGLVYLATPYSKYPGGIEAGFVAAAKVAAELLRAGVGVYSPIAHTHSLAIHGGMDPLDHEIWLPFDEIMMARADALCVAMLPSWETSRGVRHEIDFFAAAGKPVLYLECAA